MLLEQGKTLPPEIEPTVDIKIDAHIPEYYVTVSTARIEMYKKISLIDSREDASDVLDELYDRYGDIPRETESLVEVALCRALQKRVGILRVSVNGSNLIFVGEGRPDLSVWSEVIARHPELQIKSAKDINLQLRLKKNEKPLKMAIQILEDYLSLSSAKE